MPENSGNSDTGCPPEGSSSHQVRARLEYALRVLDKRIELAQRKTSVERGMVTRNPRDYLELNLPEMKRLRDSIMNALTSLAVQPYDERYVASLQYGPLLVDIINADSADIWRVLRVPSTRRSYMNQIRDLMTRIRVMVAERSNHVADYLEFEEELQEALAKLQRLADQCDVTGLPPVELQQLSELLVLAQEMARNQPERIDGDLGY